ncbi:MAG TPA: DUF2917 domain-containing protein [Burkholderiales bacterium]|nr:DUF2917 domain-containing protein [Burkholderiales bacterium]
MTLKPGQALHVRGEAGLRVSHVQGRIWVTLDGEPRDIVLQDGADLVLGAQGGALLQAVGTTAMVSFEDGVRVAPPAELRAAAPAAALADYGEIVRNAHQLRAQEIGALLARAAAAVRGLLRGIAGNFESARTRQALKGLTDYQLRDVGLRRSEIDCLVR